MKEEMQKEMQLKTEEIFKLINEKSPKTPADAAKFSYCLSIVAIGVIVNCLPQESRFSAWNNYFNELNEAVKELLEV